MKKLKAKLRAQDWLTTLRSDYQRTLNLFLMYFTHIARHYITSVIENTSCCFVTSFRFLFIYTIFILYIVLLCCKKSKLFVYFCLCHATCGNLVLQGSNLCPLHWKHGGLITGPPGNTPPQIKFYVVKLMELFLIPYLKIWLDKAFTSLVPL